MNGYISKERAEICVMSAIEGSEGDDVLRALDDVRLAIKSEPAANVAPVVHGHWKSHYDGIVEYQECSVCRKSISNSIFPYCPHCGAKMEESEDSNE